MNDQTLIEQRRDLVMGMLPPALANDTANGVGIVHGDKVGIALMPYSQATAKKLTTFFAQNPGDFVQDSQENWYFVEWLACIHDCAPTVASYYRIGVEVIGVVTAQ